MRSTRTPEIPRPFVSVEGGLDIEGRGLLGDIVGVEGIGHGQRARQIERREHGSVLQKNGFGLPLRLLRNPKSWAAFNCGRTDGYEPPAPCRKLGGLVKEITLKPCEPKEYGEHCTGQPSVVYKRAILAGAVGPVVADVGAHFLAMTFTGAELQLITEPEPHIVVAVQGERRDLIMHRIAVQTVVVRGPVFVVVEKARIHQGGIGTVARLRRARAALGAGGQSELAGRNHDIEIGQAVRNVSDGEDVGHVGVADTRPAVTKVSSPPSGRSASE